MQKLHGCGRTLKMIKTSNARPQAKYALVFHVKTSRKSNSLLSKKSIHCEESLFQEKNLNYVTVLLIQEISSVIQYFCLSLLSIQLNGYEKIVTIACVVKSILANCLEMRGMSTTKKKRKIIKINNRVIPLTTILITTLGSANIFFLFVDVSRVYFSMNPRLERVARGQSSPGRVLHLPL